MLNKLIRTLLLLCLLAAWGLAGGQPVRFNMPERAWLDQHQSLRVGVVELTPPLLFYAGGNNPQGLVADYLRALVLHLGLQLEIVRYPNKQELLTALREGEVDVLGACPIGFERQDDLAFTRPYLSLPLALYGKSELPAAGLRGLTGRLLAVTDDSGLEQMGSFLPGLRVVAVPSQEQGLEKVARGEVVAYLGDAASVDYLLKRQSYDDLEGRLQLELAYDLSLASLSDNTALLGLLQKGLDRFTIDELQEIWHRWPGVDRPQRYTAEVELGWLWILLFLAWSGALVWGVNRYVVRKEQRYNHKLKRSIRRLQRREKALKEKLLSINKTAREYQGKSRDQRQRLDLIDHVLPSAAWVWTPGSAHCQWDEHMYELFGQDPDKFDPSPDAILQQVHEDDRQGVETLFQKPGEARESRLSFRLLLPDGKVRWLLDFSEFTADTAGGEEHRIGLCWDITDFVLDDGQEPEAQSVES